MTSSKARVEHAEGVAWVGRLVAEVQKTVVGQERLIHRLLIALLTGGHVLLEGPPGLAKTLVVRTLARACHLPFQRIQFTPDLLPADLTGTLIYNPKTLEFVIHRGPIFANLVLADEINRAPAKVQSALLEAMQEHAVTIGRETYALPDPFLVLATQNPLEHDGTFPLPEAQLDRFLLHVRVGYPDRNAEFEILTRELSLEGPDIRPVIQASDLHQARQRLSTIFVDPAIIGYILDLVRATREPGSFGLEELRALIRCGASPRAASHLVAAARATALLAGRTYVLPEDVQTIGNDVLRHRLGLSFEAQADSVSTEEIVQRVFATIPTP